MNENLLRKVLDLLNRLERANIHYTLAHHQEDAITIEVAVPGQRWEIDCYGNGVTDVEVFTSDGSIRDATAVEQLLRDFSDQRRSPRRTQRGLWPQPMEERSKALLPA